MNKDSNIVIFGGNGLVGNSLKRTLQLNGFKNIFSPSRQTVNLLNKGEVYSYLNEIEADYVFVAAAKVGGIIANKTQPVEFGTENTLITLNVLRESYLAKVKKLLFLGSSCIYPKECKIPISENELLNGKLEPTNELYALSKILGIKMCQAYQEEYGCNFISCMPCNLYGPNDNFDLTSSHVLPALIRKFSDAKYLNSSEVVCWGDGSPLREFLYVDDLAKACIFLMENYSDKETINVGTGTSVSIKSLAELIASNVNYTGKITWDTTKPNGTKVKTLNTSKINNLGWKAETTLENGIKKSIEWYNNFYKKN